MVLLELAAGRKTAMSFSCLKLLRFQFSPDIYSVVEFSMNKGLFKF